MPLSLHAAVADMPHDSQPCYYGPDIIDFNQTLLAPYGMEFEHEWASKGRSITFLALAEQLLSAAPRPIPVPDLVIVTSGLPDPHSLETTLSAHLNHLLGGRAMSFAVSDQGLAAPFTALRVADSYARSGRCRRLALFILEQTTFPYRQPFAQDTGLVDSGVLLFLGPDGSWELTAPRSAGQDTTLPELIGTPGPGSLVVAGPRAVPGHADAAGASIHRVSPGSYCTSVWLELARHHRRWARDYHTIVICDTDPFTGISLVAELSRRDSPEGAHGRR